MRQSTVTYFVLFIVNPILILFFQNCSVVRLSDLKGSSPPTSVATASASQQSQIQK